MKTVTPRGGLFPGAAESAGEGAATETSRIPNEMNDAVTSR
jgi:hypothetical protein